MFMLMHTQVCMHAEAGEQIWMSSLGVHLVVGDRVSHWPDLPSSVDWPEAKSQGSDCLYLPSWN